MAFKFLVEMTNADSWPWAGSPWLVEEEDHETLIKKLVDSGLKIIDDEDPSYPIFETKAGNLLHFNQLNVNEGLDTVLKYIESADRS